MASNTDDSSTPTDANDAQQPEAMQAAPAGDDIVPAAEAKPARKRATRSGTPRTAASRAEAAKKAAATRARKKAEAAAAAAGAPVSEPIPAEDEVAPPENEIPSAPEAFAAAAPPADAVPEPVAGAIEPAVDSLADPMSDPVVLAARGLGRESDTSEQAAEARGQAPAPGFGLLFQAPTVAVEPVRSAAPTEDDEDTKSDIDSSDESDDASGSSEETGGRRSSRSRGRRRGSRSRRDDDRDDSGDDDRDDAGDDSTDDSDDTRGSRRRSGGSGGRGSEDRGDDSSRDSDDSDTDDDDDSDSDDSGAGGRGRRRRGGRGRRRAGKGGDSDDSSRDDDSGDTDDSRGDDSSDSDDDSNDDSGDNGESSGGGRRRRRRRRSGSATDGDDPPGTVTKVREPRDSGKDTATGIKGSTRLEAKRQRRREGREAGRRRTIITEAEFLARRESVERVMVVRDRGDHTQIGVLEDGVLVEHYISGGGTAAGAAGGAGASMAGNVYLGRVQNVLPSMEAAFIDIGRGRNAVLYAGEVNWDAAGLEQHKARRIENALSSGQSVVVQVTKDPIGHKGARLTSQVSLPGRYLVYVPDGSMTGISRKLPDTERARLKKILKQIVPDDAGVIVRTAAEGASEAELTADVERLRRAWEKIQKKAKTGNAPVLLHGEPDLTTRVVRDVFNEDFTKLVVAGARSWESISDYVDSVAPDLADRLHKWTGEKDVFSDYRIDEQISKAMDRKVWLPSGGSLVIDRTEAMTVVDVNTGKFTGSGGNLEETVTKNNIEAAEEIVRQLRLRDIGGIIVVDFIDMVLESNRDLVVRRLLECLGRDRTKHQVAEVTSLGLVQMTRKRVGAGLIEVFSEPCEHCSGRGVVISAEPLDRSAASSDSGSGGDSRGGRRGRRAKGGNDRNDRNDKQTQPEPQTPSGPTPAQIAAAAYAAAVQSHEAGDSEDDEQDAAERTAAVEAIVEEHLAGAEVPVPTAADADGDVPEPADVSSRGSRSTRRTGRVGGRVKPVDADAATDAQGESAERETPASPTPTPDAEDPAPAKAPARRRAGRRAAAAPVAAPSGTEAGVFTAEEAPPAKEPLTVSAAQAAAEGATAGQVDDVIAPAGEPAAEPAPAPRRRRAARRAAGAPAGPPPGSGDTDSD
ncbi:Rne/Rng family ribonuclease [Mobilicoccus caccae]|uniref:S1 motif domain-containing protein n=1 Tax=Mobilicoccus caccae TaxID=1859295 RepID=A0ABQ6ISF5_9MICO|nr:Rne/Rng family ribonuclease [Mobilicoccus caccae]GMA40082.1 hypothetical protein GCM10025883_21270 [Mobilicoccus caccae]